MYPAGHTVILKVKITIFNSLLSEQFQSSFKRILKFEALSKILVGFAPHKNEIQLKL